VIDETSFGPEHPNVATCLNNLALLLQATNRLAQAEPLMRRAVAIRKKGLVPNHPDFLQSMETLAGLLEGTGRFDESAPLRERILEAQECALGPDHSDTVRSYNLLNYSLSQHSFTLRKQGHADEAEPIDRRVAATTTKLLGDTKPLTIHRRNNLVLTLILLGKLEEARQILTAN
jgi:tetratricopeptide (TPR) repeat protein